jgi:hypothetical protein
VSDLFVYYKRPLGVGPGDIVDAIRARGIDVDWEPMLPDTPEALEGRLVPPGHPDPDAAVTVYDQDLRSYQRDEVLEAAVPEHRAALEAVDALVRLTPEVGHEFDALRVAALAAMFLARSGGGLIRREGDMRVYSAEEYAAIEPIARDGDDPPGSPGP